MSHRPSDPDDPEPLPRYPLPAFERERLDSVEEISPYVPACDALMTRIADQAAHLCGTGMGLVSLLEASEERFVGCAGIEMTTLRRSAAFCAYVILQSEPLVVEDALLDPRFRHLDCVVREPHVRAYVGAPILDPDGLPLGAVCALDAKPREFATKCVFGLRSLAKRTAAILEARRIVVEAYGRKDEGARAPLARLDAALWPLIEG